MVERLPQTHLYLSVPALSYPTNPHGHIHNYSTATPGPSGRASSRRSRTIGTCCPSTRVSPPSTDSSSSARSATSSPPTPQTRPCPRSSTASAPSGTRPASRYVHHFALYVHTGMVDTSACLHLTNKTPHIQTQPTHISLVPPILITYSSSYHHETHQQSPLSFGGFGSITRHLARLTDAFTAALETDSLARDDLRLINAYQPSLSVAWLFQRSMSVPVGKDPPPFFIGKTLVNNFKSMEALGDPVLRPFLQGTDSAKRTCYSCASTKANPKDPFHAKSFCRKAQFMRTKAYLTSLPRKTIMHRRGPGQGPLPRHGRHRGARLLQHLRHPRARRAQGLLRVRSCSKLAWKGSWIRYTSLFLRCGLSLN